MIDGPVLLLEAIDAGIELEVVFVDLEARGAASPASPLAAVVARVEGAGGRILELGPEVLRGAVDTVTPQAIAAIARLDVRPLRYVTSSASGLVLVLAGVSDPGNAGTLLRSAEAAGAKAVVVTDGSVDLFSPKTVRASAGALFRVPVVEGGPAAEVIGVLQRGGFRCIGAVARGGTVYDEAELASGVAIVLGNEAHGLEPSLSDQLDAHVTIPMEGRGESLNVAMAGTLLCFESARQRRATSR